MPSSLILLFMWLGFSEALMTSRDFHRLVSSECFRQNSIPDKLIISPPRTMKTFIELVDKVEKVHKLEDAADTSALLLRRFSISYMRHKKTNHGFMFLVDKQEESRSSILEVLLRSSPRLAFDESAFTSQEKCDLFFMLSHTVEQRTNAAGVPNYVEHGVVSPLLHPEGSSALELSAVLRGIAASKYASRESTEGLLALLRPYSRLVPEGHTVVDHLYGPSLAGLLATSVLWRNTSVSPLIGRNGVWTSPLCPHEFKISPRDAQITDAELSGAIDGFILNVITSRINNQRNKAFTLAQLFSTYYSSRGIRELIPEFPGGVSFCSRGKIFNKIFSRERLTEQVLAVARLFNAVEALPLKEVVENYAIVPSVKKFSQELEHIAQNPPSTCQEVERQLNRACQTQSNVLLLLDPIAGNPAFDTYQRKLSAYLSEKILENNPNSRVSMSSSSLAENPQILKLFFSSSYKQKNPSCRVSGLQYKDDPGCADCHESDIWRAVNGTWNNLLIDDVEMAAGTVTPSKVVIYFKFNDFKSSEEDLQSVIRSLRKSHKDLFIFVVGPKPEIVEKFRADIKDAVVVIPQEANDRTMQRIASELAHEICQTPAIVHCRNCLTDHLQVSSIHQTFLAPQSSYSWAVHPDELNRKPAIVNISVNSEYLPLRICYEKQNATHQRVPIEETNCQDVNADTPFVRTFTDLCDLNQCESVNFKITALSRRPGVPFKECVYEGCKYPDETRVEIGYLAEFEENLLQTSSQLDTYRITGYPSVQNKEHASLQKGEISTPNVAERGPVYDKYPTKFEGNNLNHNSLTEVNSREISKYPAVQETDAVLHNTNLHKGNNAHGNFGIRDNHRLLKTQPSFDGNHEIHDLDNESNNRRTLRGRGKARNKQIQNEGLLETETSFSFGEQHTRGSHQVSHATKPFTSDYDESSLSADNPRKNERIRDYPRNPTDNIYSDAIYESPRDSREVPLDQSNHKISREGYTSRERLYSEERRTPIRQENDLTDSDVTINQSSSFKKDLSFKTNFRQHNYPRNQFIDKSLRPIEMAAVCSESNQKNYLLSLDQFLLIVKKIERANPSANVGEITRFLLDKYSLDSPIRQNSSIFQGDVIRSVQRALIGHSSRNAVSLTENHLEASEKCHLYHLLSYSKGRQLENGVVALDFDEDIAISLNSVLLGIIGSPSLIGESFRSVKQMARSLNNEADVHQEAESRITILNALTFGGILLPEIIRDHRSDLVDSDNRWHDSFCPYDFVRNEPPDDADSWITYSRIRGAIDGYIIGLHANISSATSLSELLSGYYSNRAVGRSAHDHVAQNEFNRLTVCRRYDLFPADMLTGNLEREFINFYRAFAYAFPSLVEGTSEARVMSSATKVIHKITLETEHKLLSMPSFCDDGPALSIANPTIETPADIYVILKTDDLRSMPIEEMQHHWAHQKAFVSFLARQLNLGEDRKIRLHINQQSVHNGELLSFPTQNPLASSIACQTQRVFRKERMKYLSPQNEATVLESLHQELLNSTRQNVSLRSSKIVVWMTHGSEQRSPQGVIKRAVEALKRDFRDVVFFAVTTARHTYFGEDLFSVKYWDKDRQKGALSIRNRARDLARESFLAPAVPTCTECGDRLAHVRYEEDISENALKVFKFSADEFPNLVKAQVSLKSVDGAIKVCYDKIPDVTTVDGWKRCTQVTDNVLAFRPDCQKDGQCEAIYLAIFGVSENCEGNRCKGKVRFILDYDERPRKRRQSHKSQL